jgi:septum formation protein
MPEPLLLASGSVIRRQLLERAGVMVQAIPARIDETALREALIAEGAPPRDVADALAEAKARKMSDKHPDRLVLGCDQVLEHRGVVFSKPQSLEQARTQIQTLRADRHSLLSAAVIYESGKPLWRHVGVVRLTMRAVTDSYIDDYLTRNWDSVRESVGGYKLEEEGARLFTRIDGVYFTVLGLPMLEILSYLTLRGDIAG